MPFPQISEQTDQEPRERCRRVTPHIATTSRGTVSIVGTRGSTPAGCTTISAWFWTTTIGFSHCTHIGLDDYASITASHAAICTAACTHVSPRVFFAIPVSDTLGRPIDDFAALVCRTLNPIAWVIRTLTAETYATWRTLLWITVIFLAGLVSTGLPLGTHDTATADFLTLAVNAFFPKRTRNSGA